MSDRESFTRKPSYIYRTESIAVSHRELKPGDSLPSTNKTLSKIQTLPLTYFCFRDHIYAQGEQEASQGSKFGEFIKVAEQTDADRAKSEEKKEFDASEIEFTFEKIHRVEDVNDA